MFIEVSGLQPQEYFAILAPFPPSLEFRSENNPDPLLDRNPAEAIVAQEVDRVPVLLTMNKDEGGGPLIACT
jgi:hypothetical protein